MGSGSVWLNSCTPNHLPSSSGAWSSELPRQRTREPKVRDTHHTRQQMQQPERAKTQGSLCTEGPTVWALLWRPHPTSFLTSLKSQLSETRPTCPTTNTTPTLNNSFSSPLLSFSFIASISREQRFLLILFLSTMYQGTEYLRRSI